MPLLVEGLSLSMSVFLR